MWRGVQHGVWLFVWKGQIERAGFTFNHPLTPVGGKWYPKPLPRFPADRSSIRRQRRIVRFRSLPAMPFGQLIIGPPGSGKSTYCNGMNQFLSAIGRKPSLINLDPANNKLPYRPAIDICDFVTLEEIMETQCLGPNGGLLFAMDTIYDQLDSFVSQIKRLGGQEYFLFDCPGQIELFTHHTALAKLFQRLEKQLNFRLVVINLSDCVYITSPNQYVSIVLLALRTMLQFNLPQINVLSKIDMLSSYGELPFRLDYYTEVENLEYLLEAPEASNHKFTKLTDAIAQLVSDFSLVQFKVLAVENKRSMIALLNVVDKASGYLFGSTEIGGDSVWIEATRQGGLYDIDLHDRWVENKSLWDTRENEDELERAAKGDASEWPIEEYEGMKAGTFGRSEGFH